MLFKINRKAVVAAALACCLSACCCCPMSKSETMAKVGQAAADATFIQGYSNQVGIAEAAMGMAGTPLPTDYVEVGGTAKLNASCAPDGLMGMESTAKRVAICSKGHWTFLDQLKKVSSVKATTETCGNEVHASEASCPAGTEVIGGGYELSKLSVHGQQQSNAPAQSMALLNGWKVAADKSAGDTCFRAYAVCGQ